MNGILSRRQVEVLRFVARGYTSVEIASALRGPGGNAISVATVGVHRHTINRRLGVSSPTAAVVAAVRRGILRLSEVRRTDRTAAAVLALTRGGRKKAVVR